MPSAVAYHKFEHRTAVWTRLVAQCGRGKPAVPPGGTSRLRITSTRLPERLPALSQFAGLLPANSCLALRAQLGVRLNPHVQPAYLPMPCLFMEVKRHDLIDLLRGRLVRLSVQHNPFAASERCHRTARKRPTLCIVFTPRRFGQVSLHLRYSHPSNQLS